ncbi:MAG: lamin tail domain-containing protein [Myxococcota bacterium]|nr:lamin tail domain-containing protein [Myxococcota bacterium]
MLSAPLLRKVVFSLGILILQACQVENNEDRVCSAQSGQLVITEFFVDPAGTDFDGEWFEVYNASDEGQEINRMLLERYGVSGDGGITRQAYHSVRRGMFIPAKSHRVFGNAGSLDFLHYSYDLRFEHDGTDSVDSSDRFGESFGTLGQESGGIGLRCGTTLIDSIIYGGEENLPAPKTGNSLALDGSFTPDSRRNDSREYWCETSSEEGAARPTTPGENNPLCGFLKCDDGGVSRDTVFPVEGDLLITEVFANPGGSDQGFEWIEIQNHSQKSVDLNGLLVEVIRASGAKGFTGLLERAKCFSLAPGAYGVFYAAQGSSPVVEGGAVVGFEGLSVPNGAGTQVRISLDGAVLSSVVFESDVADGMSWMRDALSTTPKTAAGDGCLSGDGFQVSDEPVVPTPGFMNGICGSKSCVVDGGYAEIVELVAGDVIVSEVYAYPKTGGKDFLELYVAADESRYLNGLEVAVAQNDDGSGNSRKFSLLGKDCIVADAGSYFLMAPEADTTLNGNLKNIGMVVDSLALYNTNALKLTLTQGDLVIDESHVLAAQSGYSYALNPANLSATGNDTADAYCQSQLTGVFDGRGSPGFANVCGAGCLVDGQSPQAARVALEGALIVSELMANPDSTDSKKEWVEFYNAGSVEVDVGGILLVAKKGESPPREELIGLDQCYPLGAGEFLVAGGSESEVAVDVIVDGLNMFNSDLEIEIRGQDGTTLFSTPVLMPRSGSTLYRASDGSWCLGMASPGESNPVSC